jgi:hypothetical protein
MPLSSLVVYTAMVRRAMPWPDVTGNGAPQHPGAPLSRIFIGIPAI